MELLGADKCATLYSGSLAPSNSKDTNYATMSQISINYCVVDIQLIKLFNLQEVYFAQAEIFFYFKQH